VLKVELSVEMGTALQI